MSWVGWHDEVTGLPGTVFWRTVMTAESARHARYGRPITIVLVEISGLDRLAASSGDDVATQAVLAIGRVLRSGCRTSDYLARLGSGRFGLLLPETDEVAAINFIERVRDRCARQLRGTDDPVSVAFGWASPTPSQTLLAVESRAEARLGRELAAASSPR